MRIAKIVISNFKGWNGDWEICRMSRWRLNFSVEWFVVMCAFKRLKTNIKWHVFKEIGLSRLNSQHSLWDLCDHLISSTIFTLACNKICARKTMSKVAPTMNRIRQSSCTNWIYLQEVCAELDVQKSTLSRIIPFTI